jgi:hypothetical protein
MLRLAMYRYMLMEIPHADFGPMFETREEADAALARIAAAFPDEVDDYGVFELDETGWPIVHPVEEDVTST